MRSQSQLKAATVRNHRLRLFSVSALALTSVLAATSQAQTLSKQVQDQIADVLAVKESFTPAEQKMDSRLVFAARQASGQDIGTAAKALVRTGAADSIQVEILTTSTATEPFRRSVAETYGGKVINSHPAAGKVLATVPLANLANLANDASVQTVRVPPHFMLNVGPTTSQGYIVEKAKAIGAEFGFRGQGIKVGVLSDSASQAQVDALIASGDLKPTARVIVPFNDGKGGDKATDEGAAIMEIIQDMAPDATVYFATAYYTSQDFAANIIALQEAGCQVIDDDVGLSGEGPFQDDVVAQAIDYVTALGVLYCSSAGNEGNVASGTSGTWQGNFVSDGAYTPPGSRNFTKSYDIAKIGANDYDEITLLGEPYVDLNWSDPLGKSKNDYDFFVVDSTGTILKGFSVTVQNGHQDPVEELDATEIGGNYRNPKAGDRLIVTKVTSAARRFLRIDTNGGELATFTNGSTSGHSAAAATFGVAATFWDSSLRGAVPDSTAHSYPPEIFTSDGPRQIFYYPDGTPITPGNFLASGGEVLLKPDATGVDGVSCDTPGFSPFFGTSAAGPHAAGTAALILSADPSLTNTQVRNAMTSTAVEHNTTGVYDVTSGYGLIDALAALIAAQTTQANQ